MGMIKKLFCCERKLSIQQQDSTQNFYQKSHLKESMKELDSNYYEE
jgi:hypothetical protein